MTQRARRDEGRRGGEAAGGAGRRDSEKTASQRSRGCERKSARRKGSARTASLILHARPQVQNRFLRSSPTKRNKSPALARALVRSLARGFSAQGKEQTACGDADDSEGNNAEDAGRIQRPPADQQSHREQKNHESESKSKARKRPFPLSMAPEGTPGGKRGAEAHKGTEIAQDGRTCPNTREDERKQNEKGKGSDQPGGKGTQQQARPGNSLRRKRHEKHPHRKDRNILFPEGVFYTLRISACFCCSCWPLRLPSWRWSGWPTS